MWASLQNQIANDLCVKSSELLKIEAHDEQQKTLKSTLNLWWGLWITSTILSSVGSQFSKQQFDKDFLIIGAVISLISTIISVFSGIYCIKFIQKYSKVESELIKIEGVSTSNFSEGNSDLLDSAS